MKPRRPPIGGVGDSAGSTEFGIQGRGSRVCASSQPAPSCVIRRGASPHSGPQVRRRRGGLQAPQLAAGFGPYLRRALGAAAGFLPRPFADKLVRGIRAGGGRRLASRAWTGGSAGASASTGRMPRRLEAVRRGRAPRVAGLRATGYGARVGERAGSCCSARPSGARPTAVLSLTSNSC